MATEQSNRPARYPSAELAKGDQATGERDPTDYDTQIGQDEVRSRGMGEVSEGRSDACQNGCETNYGVKRCDCLRELHGGHTTTYPNTCTASDSGEERELGEDVGAKTDGEKGGHNTERDSENTKNISLACGDLGR